MWTIEQPSFIGDITLPSAFEVVEFTASALKAFGKYLHSIYQSSFPYAILNISSDGGDVGVMCGFLSLMESYRKKGVVFVGVVKGYAFSAGCAVFLFCDNGFRFMGPAAHIMFHNSQGSHHYTRLSSMKKYSEFYVKYDDQINEKLSLHLKKGKTWLSNQLKKESHDDWMITAEQANELGLCNIGLPDFNLKLSAEFSIVY